MSRVGGAGQGGVGRGRCRWQVFWGISTLCYLVNTLHRLAVNSDQLIITSLGLIITSSRLNVGSSCVSSSSPPASGKVFSPVWVFSEELVFV